MKLLKRPCSKCGRYFIPTGKFCKVCDKCNPKNNKKYPKWLNEENKSKVNSNA